MPRSGADFEFFDLIDLLLLKLAKVRRARLTGGASDYKEFYEDFFTENDQDVLLSSRDPRRLFRQEEVNRALKKFVPEGELVVDVGCGLGDNLAGIPSGHWRLAGIEYAMETAKVAKSRLSNRAFIARGSGTALPVASGAARAVTCLEVLEHIADDAGVLKEIHRILTPGGFLIAAVPYRFWFKDYLPLMGHYRHYSRSTFVSMLEGAGFRVVEYLPNCPRWSRLINYAYVASRILALAHRIVGQRKSPLDAKLPGARAPLISVLTDALRPKLEAERRVHYGSLETSTFVLASKS